MQLADILSDLATLRVCDPKDALSLVKLPTSSNTSSTTTTTTTSSTTSTKNTEPEPEPETDNDPLLHLARKFLHLYENLATTDLHIHRLQDLRRRVLNRGHDYGRQGGDGGGDGGVIRQEESYGRARGAGVQDEDYDERYGYGKAPPGGF